MLRPACAAVISALILGGLALSAPGHADARPRISSFYVKDEGRQIQLKVNFCDYTGDLSDSFSSTFRIWDENGPRSTKVFQRRVSGRIYDHCGYAYIKVPDTFANGLYSANVAVTNRTNGSFSRIGARFFRVS